MKHSGHGHVFYRRLTHDYPTVDRGEGVYLYDTAGRRYLDAAGGAMVVNVGHGVAKVVDAMAAQARRVAFAHGTSTPRRKSFGGYWLLTLPPNVGKNR